MSPLNNEENLLNAVNHIDWSILDDEDKLMLCTKLAVVRQEAEQRALTKATLTTYLISAAMTLFIQLLLAFINAPVIVIVLGVLASNLGAAVFVKLRLNEATVAVDDNTKTLLALLEKVKRDQREAPKL